MSDDLEEADASSVTITQPWTELDLVDVKGSSARRYIDAASEQFQLSAATTRTLSVGAVFKSGEREGQRRPEKETTHLWVTGISGKVAWFRLHFEETTFKGSWVWDVVGHPVELYNDYTLNKAEQRAYGFLLEGYAGETPEERAARQDAAYNDGEVYIDHLPRLIERAGEFEEWLHEMIPNFTPRKKAQRKMKPEPETGLELLEIGHWG